MKLLFDLLTLWGPSLVRWTATQLLDQAESEYFDESKVRGELLDLQGRYDTGEVDEETYERQETILLERLRAVRELSGQRG